MQACAYYPCRARWTRRVDGVLYCDYHARRVARARRMEEAHRESPHYRRRVEREEDVDRWQEAH